MRWAATGLLACLAVSLMITRDAGPTRARKPPFELARAATDVRPRLARVQAQLVAGPYTYVELRGDDASLYWAVTLGRAPPPGTRVRVRSFGQRRDFYSPRLQRRFPELVFGIVSRND